jgi:UDP-N-acetylglucosamine:LPS N-acetylglucosamine transferase
MKILFFSRGRGRGHAIPDLAIANALRPLIAGAHVQFASYARGAATLAEHGEDVIDLGLPEDNPYLETLIRVQRAILQQRPEVVISHEEFAVLPAARAFGLPTAMIVDFFMSGKSLWMDSLEYADEVVFIEREGLFPEPPAVKGRVRYVGPVVREMSVTRADLDAMRAELNLPAASIVVSVMPGSWATEQRAPIVDLVVPAFESLPMPGKHLVWVAGDDYETLRARFGRHASMTVLKSCWPIERLMVASDVVITKANRGTTIDLASLGVPSISLSFGLNPIDETIIPRVHSNVALDARGTSVSFLRATMERVLEEPIRESEASYRPGGAALAAEALAGFIAKRRTPRG